MEWSDSTNKPISSHQVEAIGSQLFSCREVLEPSENSFPCLFIFLTIYFAEIRHLSLSRGMSEQLTEEEKDAIIAKQAKEIKRLKRKNKKTKSYVELNLELFESLLDVEGGVLPNFLNGREGDEKRNPRYFFTRPTKDKQSTEKVIRLNLLISDLIEAKIRLNPTMKDCTEVEYNTRRSMDITSLIAHLSEKRVTRTRKKKQ